MIKFKGVFIYEINFKNTDYNIEFSNGIFVNASEHLATFNFSFFFYKNRNLISNINNVVQWLKHAKFEHRDFVYDLYLESRNDTEVKENELVRIDFTCKGKQFRKKRIFTNQLVIDDLNTVYDIPYIVKIKNGNGNLVLNDRLNNLRYEFKELTTDQVVVIDSIQGKVSGIDNAKWNFSHFFKTKDKKINLEKNGNALIEIELMERVA